VHDRDAEAGRCGEEIVVRRGGLRERLGDGMEGAHPGAMLASIINDFKMVERDGRSIMARRMIVPFIRRDERGPQPSGESNRTDSFASEFG
jgi:hypothetical protein